MQDRRPAGQPSALRILLVDDNPQDRALAAREIRRDHPKAAFIEAGTRAALEAALGAGPPPFDIAIVDYALGWATGIEVFHRIKAAQPDCGVVMFTGTLGEEYAVEAMKAGLDDYVVKDPRRYPRLRASATAILQQREERRALQRAEADRDVLLKEVFHRVHNGLQTVMSLLRIHAGRVADAEAKRLLEGLGRRIHALALVQGRLYHGEDYRTVDFDAYLRELAEAHASLDGRPDVVIEVSAPPLRLPVEVAVPLGLIANELLTNALKHAFPGGSPGRVVISLSAGGDGSEAVLSVADDGLGLPEGRPVGGGAPRREGGIGSLLIDGLTRQIGGDFVLRRREDGPGAEARLRVSLQGGGGPG
jgi:two-component sensor histidine kinase/CheY-like chemotaxis protein